MKPNTFLTYMFLFLSLLASAQSKDLIYLDFDNFLELVKDQHPVARQANIKTELGTAAVQQARGGFDPKVYAEHGQKQYAGKEYYQLMDAGLKIPTWYGIEVKTGWEQNKGSYLNPEHKTANGGLAYAGVSVPIGKGLIIDKRRAELKQAQIYEQSSLIERDLMVNELLYLAGKSYWDWFTAYNVLVIYENALTLAKTRFEAVSQGAHYGDRPSIDTLEAGIQVQNRELNYEQAVMEYQNACVYLSVYLWSNGTIPLELEENTVPPGYEKSINVGSDTSYIDRIDSLIATHPQLKQYQLKTNQLEIERKLKRENIKPEFNINYNFLSEPINNDPFATLSDNNYKWGLEFSMPLLLRKERGAIKMANLKIQDLQLERELKGATLTAKVISAINEWNTTKAQVDLYQQTVKDYSGLLNGERQMFDSGESSLFMVNSRELGYINAQIKLVQLIAKNHKAELSSGYSLGILGQLQ